MKTKETEGVTLLALVLTPVFMRVVGICIFLKFYEMFCKYKKILWFVRKKNTFFL